MTTPTREQECKHERIKTWVFEDTKEPAMWSCADCGLKFAPEMATLTAGRVQGLREAKEVCTQRDEEGEGPDCWDWHAKDYAAAIEQLRAQKTFKYLALPSCVTRNTTIKYTHRQRNGEQHEPTSHRPEASPGSSHRRLQRRAGPPG